MRAGDRFVVGIEAPDGRGAASHAPDEGPVVVRVRDRDRGTIVRTIPLGTDVAAAEDLRERIRDDLSRYDADTFMQRYAIGTDTRPPVRRAYLGLGSNVGDRTLALQHSVDGLAATGGVAVVAVSSVYETAPVGGPEQPDYLNAVVAIDTDRTPRELLEIAKRLEDEAGRVPGERWGPRLLDVDVLLVGDDEVDEEDLVVPHPRLYERAFVMVPLAELDPMLAPWVPPGEAGVRRSEVQLVVPQTQ
ncbi:MAG TPA: 2-amino-4-hydroxy-6-hydroxymethyldihydropteridine diphosphokinase [Acidimicrobiia bacterium]|nr:2-amino-4-hydroxy-6-hydroxymethyldihydropteridine diphosphokinase [Acidimicrobiia bacterium]